ncbi:hypothetical protein BN940_00036 [Castellaniella defragrans 65Phen]|uniref:Uncharacterized protein n=1 Tax=Castellaniella defragrans (strain DSM 12143 / CCUG 39792 / 65Phen) TaxID=1437824 RepID=W8WS39_CASD6|nr:hypothetical protein BN940_00036 [Castellaniella defragrans 65Phen]
MISEGNIVDREVHNACDLDGQISRGIPVAVTIGIHEHVGIATIGANSHATITCRIGKEIGNLHLEVAATQCFSQSALVHCIRRGIAGEAERGQVNLVSLVSACRGCRGKRGDCFHRTSIDLAIGIGVREAHVRSRLVDDGIRLASGCQRNLIVSGTTVDGTTVSSLVGIHTRRTLVGNLRGDSRGVQRDVAAGAGGIDLGQRVACIRHFREDDIAVTCQRQGSGIGNDQVIERGAIGIGLQPGIDGGYGGVNIDVLHVGNSGACFEDHVTISSAIVVAIVDSHIDMHRVSLAGSILQNDLSGVGQVKVRIGLGLAHHIQREIRTSVDELGGSRECAVDGLVDLHRLEAAERHVVVALATGYIQRFEAGDQLGIGSRPGCGVGDVDEIGAFPASDRLEAGQFGAHVDGIVAGTQVDCRVGGHCSVHVEYVIARTALDGGGGAALNIGLHAAGVSRSVETGQGGGKSRACQVDRTCASDGDNLGGSSAVGESQHVGAGSGHGKRGGDVSLRGVHRDVGIVGSHIQRGGLGSGGRTQINGIGGIGLAYGVQGQVQRGGRGAVKAGIRVLATDGQVGDTAQVAHKAGGGAFSHNHGLDAGGVGQAQRSAGVGKTHFHVFDTLERCAHGSGFKQRSLEGISPRAAVEHVDVLQGVDQGARAVLCSRRIEGVIAGSTGQIILIDSERESLARVAVRRERRVSTAFLVAVLVEVIGQAITLRIGQRRGVGGNAERGSQVGVALGIGQQAGVGHIGGGGRGHAAFVDAVGDEVFEQLGAGQAGGDQIGIRAEVVLDVEPRGRRTAGHAIQGFSCAVVDIMGPSCVDRVDTGCNQIGILRQVVLRIEVRISHIDNHPSCCGSHPSMDVSCSRPIDPVSSYPASSNTAKSKQNEKPCQSVPAPQPARCCARRLPFRMPPAPERA